MARKSRKNLESTAAIPKHIYYNAAAYIRLSADVKRKPGDSLETQRDIIDNFIASSSDIRFADVYIDNNMTGTNFDRPAFQKMLADIESGKINCIIVKDLTRFGRNAIDAGYYLEKYLPMLGVRFIAVTDGFDSNDGDGGILLPLKNIISESYALDISRKVRSNYKQSIADGRFIGQTAQYGYMKSPDNKNKLVIDEEAAATVRQIFEWAHDGIGISEITRNLNEAKTVTPSQYKYDKGFITHDKFIGEGYWQNRTVRKMLKDRVYIGDMVQGKSTRVNNKRTEISPDKWVCIPNTHKAIINREFFEEVQLVMLNKSEYDKSTRQSFGEYSPNIFKGKIYCARCGYLMQRKRQNKDGIYWFRCESQWKYGKDSCVQISVKEAELKTEILTLLQHQSKILLGRYIAFEKANGSQEHDKTEAELREINQALEKDGRMLKSLFESMVGGVITKDEFVHMKSEYETKIAALSSRADEIRNARRKTKKRTNEYSDITQAVTAAVNDDRLSAEIIERLIEKIYVRPDKSVDIFFKYRSEFEEVQAQ